MRPYDRDEIWMEQARQMIAAERVQPAEDLASIADCAEYNDLTAHTRAALVALASSPRRYPRGDYLCVEGLRADKAFFLKRGRVAIVHEVDQIEQLLRFGYPGEVIGDMALLAPNRRRTASCLAAADTEAWVIDYDRLDALRADPGHVDLRRLLERLYVGRRVETRLLQHPWTARLDRAERVCLAGLVENGAAVSPRVVAGERIVRAKTPVEHVALLLDGAVDLVSSREAGTEATFTTAERRALFLGLPAVFGTVTWPADVVMRSDGWIARLPVDALRGFVTSRPALRDAIAEVLIASAGGRAMFA